MYKLSIVIPVFNNWKYTNSVLRWFYDRNDFEVIVVDNYSSDETEFKLIELAKTMTNLVVIRNDNNTGFGYAVNQGINAAKSDNILILNNDIMIGTNADNWLLNLIPNNNELVGPSAGLLDSNFNFVYETQNVNDDFNYMSGWCLCANKQTWNSLVLPGTSGPFDNKTFFCYFEDTDLSFRAKKIGINFRLQKIPVHHIGKQTSRHMNTNALYTESKAKFIARWSGKGMQ